MLCPHCGGDTPVEQSSCVHCGKPLTITGGAVFAQEPSDEGAGDWGPRLLRYFIGLVVLACVLGIGGSHLKKRPLTESKIERPRLLAPRPKFPTPVPPKTLPEAPLVEPESVAIPEMPTIEMAFGSRDQRVRKLFVERKGGDPQTEAAVESGLQWLKSAQEADGRWDCARFGGRAGNSLGVTGLALLAFLGGGHAHQGESPHKDAVGKALNYVLSKESAEGKFPGALYTQGICTMAIVEAYGMTGDTTVLPHAEKAVSAIIAGQQECGGWDYTFSKERDRGDTSVTGWQVMALKSAKRVGIAVPDRVLEKMREFLKGVTREDGAIGYENRSPTGRKWRTGNALTAAGLNAHLFAAAPLDDDFVQKAVGVLLRSLPEEPKLKKVLRDGKHVDEWVPRADMYYWYHGSLALSRIGGLEWKAWNTVTKRLLLRLQKKSGPEAGSWDTYGDRFRQQGGRIYFTSLALLALEVYYRYD